MGSGRLPGAQALAAAIVLWSGTVIAGCGSASNAAGPTSGASATATAQPPSTPSPTATPDPLDRFASSAEEARTVVAVALASDAGSACPQRLQVRWKVLCAEGDLDNDGKPDRALLVPLTPRSDTTPNAAVVFVQLARRGALEAFPAPGLVADESTIGREAFGIGDFAGDGTAQLSFITDECGARGCSSRVQLLRWDGSAWRDAGPDLGIDNLDAPVRFDGAGDTRTLTIHGGKLTATGAGPSRASTYRFVVQSGRFELKAQTPDAPAYLFHAVQDADALFDAGDFPAAISAYRSAIANEALKDWRKESGEPEGRPALEAYALFRVAVATAATGDDPNAAIDETIARSKEPLFVNGVEAFRRGFQERRAVQAGCAAATTYFTTVTAESDVPAYVRAMFYYGFANLPVKGPKDLCPL